MFRHFKFKEFASPDLINSGYFMDTLFIVKLDNIRQYCGFPLRITSGYRTLAHNKKVGGKKNSAHLRGLAVDVRCRDSSKRFIIVEAALYQGIMRIGIGKTFIHLDGDITKAQEVMWLY